MKELDYAAQLHAELHSPVTQPIPTKRKRLEGEPLYWVIGVGIFVCAFLFVSWRTGYNAADRFPSAEIVPDEPSPFADGFKAGFFVGAAVTLFLLWKVVWRSARYYQGFMGGRNFFKGQKNLIKNGLPH